MFRGRIAVSSAIRPALCSTGAAAVCSAVAFVLPDDVAAVEWIKIMPAGTFRAIDGRPPWTLKDPARVIAASQAIKPGGLIPVDYNHQAETAARMGGENPAAGWITALEAREGAIWARVEWTERGRQALAAKEYRFVSPAFSHDKESGVITAITSVGLVNNPALPQLPAVASASQPGDPMDELLTKLREALGLPAEADQNAIGDACCKSKASATAASALSPLAGLLKLPETADIAQIAAAAHSAISTATAPDPSKFVPIAAFTDVASQLAAAQSQIGVNQAQQAVAAAMAEGTTADPGLFNLTMPNGPKIRRCRCTPRLSPEITSTSRPSTSVERLYSNRVPGWKSSGNAASAGLASVGGVLSWLAPVPVSRGSRRLGSGLGRSVNRRARVDPIFMAWRGCSARWCRDKA